MFLFAPFRVQGSAQGSATRIPHDTVSMSGSLKSELLVLAGMKYGNTIPLKEGWVLYTACNSEFSAPLRIKTLRLKTISSEGHTEQSALELRYFGREGIRSGGGENRRLLSVAKCS